MGSSAGLLLRKICVHFAFVVSLIAPDAASAMVDGTDLSNDPLGTASGFLVSIEARESKGADEYKKCLGAAIALDLVVTAGHCLSGQNLVKVKFISKLNPLKFEVIPAKDWAIHPMFNGGHEGRMYENFKSAEAADYHDIAVILLRKPSQIGVPVSLAPMDFNPGIPPKANPIYYSFGYGRNELFVYQNNLEYTTFNYALPLGNSESWYKSKVPAGILTCEGDSGAPVTVSAEDEYVDGRHIHYLIGIQATVQGERSNPKNIAAAIEQWGGSSKIPFCGDVVTFVDMRHHVDWIREKLQEMDPKHPHSFSIYGE